MKLLSKIQRELVAPKNQYNAFGKYKYRSCEDILEAVKPLLGEACLTISDEIVLIGDRYYVRATATLVNGDVSMSVHGYAREAISRKGMNEDQLTGATSSYARKYALNGLFCIDENKTSDDTNDKPNVDPPKRTIADIIEDARKSYAKTFEKEIPEHFAVSSEKFTSALRNIAEKQQKENKGKIKYDDEGVGMLVLMLKLEDTLEEVPA